MLTASMRYFCRENHNASVYRLIFPCTLLLIIILACQDNGKTPTLAGNAQIEIDTTSGVPSPQWNLSPPEVEVIEQALSDLSPGESYSFFDGLGYRGFVIRLTSPSRVIRVQNGHVLIEQDGMQKTFADIDRLLERWLLAASKPHIEPHMYSLLEEEIGR